VSPSRCHLALAGLLLVAGCAAQPGSAAGEGGEPAAPAKAATRSTRSPSPPSLPALPLDAYVATDEQLEVLNRARGLLERDCMRRLGFTRWQPPDPRIVRQPRMYAFGLVDEQRAARHGYHSPRVADLERLWTQAARVSAAERAQRRAELAALTGDGAFGALPGKQVPSGGCSGEADRKLAEGAPPHETSLYGELVAEAEQRTVADGRVRAVVEAWSRCMSRAGFDYGSPTELAGQDGNRWSTPQPTAAEIATARADVACKKQTGLPGVWLETAAGYQRQLIERHQLVLDQLQRDLAFKLRRANEIIRGSRG
jgi:hypothetical protein